MAPHSRFANVDLATMIGDLALTRIFKRDTNEKKIDLGIGVNYADYGLQLVFPIVRDVEKIIAGEKSFRKHMLPWSGLAEFTTTATSLLLGNDSPAILERRAFGVQVLSGIGGMRVAAEFLVNAFNCKYFYDSQPSTPGHSIIFQQAGFLENRVYRYWSETKKDLDIDGMLKDLDNAPELSVVVLYACSHNPTGCDLNKQQWEQVADVIQERNLFPIMNVPFLGIATGNCEKDAWPIRYFVERNIEMFCVQSFSKLFGISNERVGNLVTVVNDPSLCAGAQYVLESIIKPMYSTPPCHGARIVAYILNDEVLFETWQQNILEIHNHITKMRIVFRRELEKINTPGDWSHITSQKGIFSYSGLNARQTMYLFQRFHIYIPISGRISLCSVTPDNVEYIAAAISETVSKID